MKKTMAKISKVLAIVLSVLTIMSIMPMQTFATEYQNYQTLTTIDVPEDDDLVIQEEVVSERTANSKTYLLEDGTYCSLTTSEPIHTCSDGEWVDVDTSSELPETINEAMDVLSLAQSSSTDVGVDDGFIETATEQSINIWGITLSDNFIDFTISEGQFTLTGISAGVLKVNTDSKGVYNKTEVTVKADIRLSCSNTQETENILIRPIYDNWDSDTLSPEIISNNADTPILDYNAVDGSGRYVWDITSEYIKWESGAKANNGLLMTPGTSTTTTTIYNGILRRQYRVIDDNDLGFTYHDVDMGRAGTLYVNDYTNVPYLVRDELALDGNIMPVSIARFINTSVENNSFGAGGRWNYESKLSKTADTYIWDMFNGSSARFQRAIPIETDGVGREKWVEYQYNAQGYTLWIDTIKSRDFDYSNNRIVDESGNTYTFTYYGFVNSVISGANPNDIINIAYAGETISSITDGIGRKYSFAYGTINNRAVVTKISVYTTDGNSETPIEIVPENSNGNGTPVAITFENEIINHKEHLTKATYADGKSAEYTYDSIGRLTGIKNIDGNLLELNYAISASDVGQNVSPVYAHRLSGYTKKCLNENGEYIIEYTVNINSENAYRRTFDQIYSQSATTFSEIFQFNRNLDLLYMTNSAEDSFYADYNNSHKLLSLVTPEPDNSNMLSNGNMEKYAWTSKIPLGWSVCDHDDQPLFKNPIRVGTNKCVQFESTLGKTLILEQEVKNFSGHKGDKFIISSWGKGEATIPKDEHFWGVRVFAKNQNSEQVQIHQMLFDTTAWGVEQERFTAFSLPFDTSSITVQLVSAKQNNILQFDDVYLCKAENAYVAAVDDVQPESSCKCEGCEYPFCACSCETEENCTCISCNIKTTSTNDAHGNPLETKNTDGLKSVFSKNEYTDDGNYLSKYIDENNVKTSYEYSLTNGLLLSQKLANDSTVSYGYDAIGTLKTVSQDVTNVLTGNTVTMNTEYGYENDKIKSVTHNGFSYNYEYDIYGNVESISVGETKLVSYAYNRDHFGNISKITYANGDEIIYSYDNNDNIIGIKFKDDADWRYTYTYDEYNQLKSFTDNVAKRITTYNKTISGVKYIEVVETLGEESQIIYGVTDAKSDGQYTQSVFGKDYSIKSEIGYDSKTGYTTYTKTSGTVVLGKDGIIKNVCTKDAFERIVSDYMTMETNPASDNSPAVSLSMKNEYTYKNPSDTQTTRLVDTYTSSVYFEADSEKEVLRQIDLKYDYDSAGRITMISIPDSSNGTTVYQPINMYEYDEAGHLTVEANMYLGMVCSYTYDAGGNLTSKNYHDNADYDEANKKIILGEPTDTIVYEYDSVWKDKLISYNGMQINYDSLGNPLNYTASVFGESDVNMKLEWTGRLLTAANAVDGSIRYEYSYDAAGLRTEKKIYKGETISKEIVDGNGNTVITEENIFIPFIKFEYIWSNDVPAGYRILFYEPDKNENGEYIIDDNGQAAVHVNEKSSLIVNVIYNENGDALGVTCYTELSGEEQSLTFMFVKDAQGNIASISALEGGYFFNFVYDAYGNCMIDASGPEIDKIQQNINNAKNNVEKILYAIGGAIGIAVVAGITFACVPNAYKGYIMDLETGLYYCQSRYYSPSWGRFINADDTTLLEMTKGEVHGANLFTYCNNDPINNIDPNGYLSVKTAGYIIDGILLAINIASSALALKASIKAIRIISKEFVRLTKKKIVNMLRPLLGTISKAVIGFAVPALQSVAAYAVDLFFDMSFGYAIALAIYKYVPASRRVLTR